MSEEQQELKPCPFCGSQPVMCGNNNPAKEYWVTCKHCEKFSTSEEKAAQLWNTRALSSPQGGEVDKNKIIDLIHGTWWHYAGGGGEKYAATKVYEQLRPFLRSTQSAAPVYIRFDENDAKRGISTVKIGDTVHSTNSVLWP